MVPRAGVAKLNMTNDLPKRAENFRALAHVGCGPGADFVEQNGSCINVTARTHVANYDHCARAITPVRIYG